MSISSMCLTTADNLSFVDTITKPNDLCLFT